MSVQRACKPCRDAKAKCDRARPFCERCHQRGIQCHGYPDEADVVFLDQNETARRNSERARGQRSSAIPAPRMPLSLPMPLVPEVDMVLENILPSSEAADNLDEEDLPWLNKNAKRNVPEPVRRDLETRAVERFFVNWVLHPCNHGVSPGHLQDLPVLYMGAHSESVVRSAVEALAYAELGDKRDSADSPFYVRARSAYGAALNRMRTVAAEEQRVANDRVLVALLLIDNFELMHLGRMEPLGPHGDVVRHVLEARGNEQFYSAHSFALWRIAHHRLQARQILHREGPDRIQEEWLSKLDITRPDIHISADVLHMNILCAAVRKLLESRGGSPAHWQQRAEHLVATIRDFLTSIETWTSNLSPRWKSTQIDRQHLARPRTVPASEASSLLPDGSILTFHDKWLAYMWNFHSASQIVLRESLIELLEASADSAQASQDEYVADIESQLTRVRDLSANIVSILPTLLGFTDDPDEEAIPSQKGDMAGRFFCLFSMWVIQRAKYSLPEHQQLANRVTDWIKNKHEII